MEIGEGIASKLEEAGLIAIIRATFEVDIVNVANALVDGGFRAIEVTLNTPKALESISTLRSFNDDRILVGAGTILSETDAMRAFNAGAQYIVTPTMQLDTVAFCVSHNIPIFCGCFTPTEALTAHNAGADFIKLFPSNVLGPSFISALLAPLPFLKIFPTGGISAENVAEYIKAGCKGAAVGSNLVSKKRLIESDWTGLRDASAEYIKALDNARSVK